MPRHSRQSLGTLLAWYAGCGAVGAASVLLVAVLMRASDVSLTVQNMRVGLLLALLIFAVGVVLAWRKVEPRYKAHQVRAMLTGTSGLSVLAEMIEEKRKRKP